MMNLMRINKFISKSGIASRRKADELVIEGHITINDEVVTLPGNMVNLDTDIVKYKGEIIRPLDKKYYLMLNKPVGYTCTNSKKFDDKVIFDLIDIDTKLFSIGRLDKDSRGLILITNDGDVYNNVIHPRADLYKTYLVQIDKNFDPNHKENFEKGIDIGGYITNPAIIRIINNRLIEIKITEGKNRQIRRMFASLNYKVLDLYRTKIGKIELGSLASGRYRNLTEDELSYLKDL